MKKKKKRQDKKIEKEVIYPKKGYHKSLSCTGSTGTYETSEKKNVKRIDGCFNFNITSPAGKLAAYKSIKATAWSS